jgi:hypothetical protein
MRRAGAARIGYLRFARFHAVLEFCVAALLLVESRTIVTRREAMDEEGAPSRP